MQGVRLQHVHPLLGLDPGQREPYWQDIFRPGRPLVRVSGDHCSIVIRGGDFAAYGAAVQAAVRLKLGPETDDDYRARYKPVLPGQVIGCLRDIRYSSYQAPRGSYVIASFDRAVDCARDRMWVTR